MATSTPNDLEVTALPPEVLVEIFNLVDHKDLPNVRLTCKKLCESANRPFGFAFFTERAHVVSPHSINALVDITEHPIFGSYVKSVGICSARASLTTGYSASDSVERDAGGKALLNGYVKTGRFARRMKRVFDNIRLHSKSVTISIYNEAPDQIRFENELCLAPDIYFGWARLVKQSPGKPIFEPAETLEHTVYAARRAACPVSCLRMDFPSSTRGLREKLQERLDTAVQQILESSTAPLSLHVDGLRYHDESASLEVAEFEPKWRDDATLGCALNAFYCWVKAKRIVHLRFHDNRYYKITSFRPLLTSHLQHLELDGLFTYCWDFDRYLWSGQIRSLCDLAGLRYCKLECLEYVCQLQLEDMADDVYLVLRGAGRYLCDYDRFYLLFSDGTTLFEASGESVCTELEEMVCYLEASEQMKCLQIISDGRVSNDIVGIIVEVFEDGLKDLGVEHGGGQVGCEVEQMDES